LFSKQEEICEQPEFTLLNEGCEQIFEALSASKAKVLKRDYYKDTLYSLTYHHNNQHT